MTRIKGLTAPHSGLTSQRIRRDLKIGSLSSGSSLHPIKDYTGTIVGVLKQPYEIGRIRSGGLNPDEQTRAFRKILARDPHAGQSLIKKQIKRVLAHYGRGATEIEETAPATKQATAQYYRQDREYAENKGRASISAAQETANAFPSANTINHKPQTLSSISQRKPAISRPLGPSASKPRPAISLAR